MLSLVRVGKEWVGTVFLHPDNLHAIDAFTSQSGERMGQPSFSPPPKNQRLYAYSWQGKVDAFTCWGGERMDHTDNHLPKIDALSFQGGERCAGPVLPPPL